MQKGSNKGGFLSSLAGLAYIFLLFGLVILVVRELRRGNILVWIYLIAVAVYVFVYGTKGLT